MVLLNKQVDRAPGALPQPMLAWGDKTRTTPLPLEPLFLGSRILQLSSTSLCGSHILETRAHAMHAIQAEILL